MPKVEWAPLNVPLNRRLQTIAAAVEMFLVILGHVASLAIFAMLLVSRMRNISVFAVLWFLGIPNFSQSVFIDHFCLDIGMFLFHNALEIKFFKCD